MGGSASKQTTSVWNVRKNGWPLIYRPICHVLKSDYFLGVCISETPADIKPRDETLGDPDFMTYYGDCQQYTSIPKDIPLVNGRLFIRGNPITALYDGDFNQFSELDQLDISYNTIAEIQDGAWSGLNQLVSLKLEHNYITVISENMLGGLPELTDLVLYNNAISEIEVGALSGLNKLRNLWLSDNAILEIQKNLFDGLALRSLHLENNKIHSLHPQAFEGADVRDLHMANNELQVIDSGTFTNVTSLEWIDLSGNQLHTLERAILPKEPSLNTNRLFLHSNKLTTFLPSVYSGGFPRRLQLTLHDNPLVCDSSTCWMREEEENGWLTWDSQYPQCYGYMMQNCKTGKCFRNE